jgi:hypothetical protein
MKPLQILTPRNYPVRLPLFMAGLWLGLAATALAEQKPFRIRVVDDVTSRGVPLVELQTVNDIRFVTDSNGIVAFDEPGLMNQSVFFLVQSHGYEFPKDGFGFAGQAIEIKPGGEATFKIRRINIAQRLYRVTGAGNYRDTLLTGGQPPTREPVLNGLVLGSDSVLTAVFRGKIHWFWGDTNRSSYPLGNFDVPGATSELPGSGGLDPNVGVDLTYFVDDKGFARPTAKMPGTGPTWIDSLVVLKEPEGRERMFGWYMKIKPPLEVYQRGLAEFDADSNRFAKVIEFPQDAPAYPSGHTFLRREDDIDYIYFCHPYPLVRVRANPASLKNLTEYEAYTCLKPDSTLADPQIDREPDGKVRYSWKANTPVVGPGEQKKLIADKHLRSNEGLLQLADRETGKPVVAHHGTVAWNEFRKRWVMITVEIGGSSSHLGEVWYAEADSPLGPWAYAVKIVSHNKYSFYNPKHHAMLDQNGGRTIFFEGTYTHTFSGNPEETTPRYEYNQIMYRLDLDDPRLNLAVAEKSAAE